MIVTVALAGDTMLGRGVAEALAGAPAATLVAPEVVEVMQSADLAVLNLECCISERGRRWPAPGKPFFFRAPPKAVELLQLLDVGCVTMANNHALDYGPRALLDTLEHLAEAGIAVVGAGPDLEHARRPAILDTGGLRLAVIGVTDHPADFAAGSDHPGVAFADLIRGVPGWLREIVRDAAGAAEMVLVTPHWGPNMTQKPPAYVRLAADVLVEAGATLVAGHSAHVPHGMGDRVLYDLGGFLDDYTVDRRLRNDLGLLFLVVLDRAGPVRLEAVPLKLDFCRTRLASGADAAWMRRRFRKACAALGTDVNEANGRLAVHWR
jgi:poly-gamma-glutamate capsule biosynthesis protein CapA/YwtB (metallophosphatase superfamily)